MEMQLTNVIEGGGKFFIFCDALRKHCVPLSLAPACVSRRVTRFCSIQWL